MKQEEINIRIEPHLKEDFKKLCNIEGYTMSEKLTELIDKEVNSKNSIKLTLIRKILDKHLPDCLFLSAADTRNKIIEVLKNHLSFDFEVKEIINKNNVFFGKILVNDNDNNYCLDYTITNSYFS